MAFQTTATALGNLMLGQCCQKTPSRPIFLVGLGSKRGPNLLDGGETKFGKEQLDAGGIAGIGGSHPAPTGWTVLSSS
jgi:hypothetical protein